MGLDILFCSLGAGQILALVAESQSHHTMAEQVGFRETAAHPPFKHLPCALCPCWAHDAVSATRGCLMSRDLNAAVVLGLCSASWFLGALLCICCGRQRRWLAEQGAGSWPQVSHFLGQVPVQRCSVQPFIVHLVQLLRGAPRVIENHNDTCSCIQLSFCSCCPGQSLTREVFVSFWVCDKYKQEVRCETKEESSPCRNQQFRAACLKVLQRRSVHMMKIGVPGRGMLLQSLLVIYLFKCH